MKKNIKLIKEKEEYLEYLDLNKTDGKLYIDSKRYSSKKDDYHHSMYDLSGYKKAGQNQFLNLKFYIS